MCFSSMAILAGWAPWSPLRTLNNSGSVVTLRHKLAAQFTTLPITRVLDNARYARNAYVFP